MENAMKKALEADGEKLRQMTGEDHGPVFFHVKRDPLVCPDRDGHEFTGWREFEDGRGEE